jgi:8-oxo-dGTP diphosphatase
MSKRTRIGIAVVESVGHYLVGVRGANGTLAGMAEFPGGKCECDETPRTCAVRECREETGLMVTPRDLWEIIPWSYQHGDVELHVWRCLLVADLPDLASPRAPFRWIPPTEVGGLTFPPANAAILSHLTANP